MPDDQFAAMSHAFGEHLTAQVVRDQQQQIRELESEVFALKQRLYARGPQSETQAPLTVMDFKVTVCSECLCASCCLRIHSELMALKYPDTDFTHETGFPTEANPEGEVG